MDTTRRSVALPSLFLAILFSPATAFAGSIGDWLTDDQTLDTLARIGAGVGILFGGWLLARMVSGLVFSLLCKTDIDDKIAKALGVEMLLKERGKQDEHAVERFISKIAFYLLMLFVVISALDFAGLNETAGPIRNFLDTIVQALPLVGKAALILGVAYFAGYILRKLVTTALEKSGVDAKLAKVSEGDAEGKTFSATAGAVIFWLLMLIGVAGAFEALQIDAVATPLRGLIDQVVTLLPALAVAGLILLGGFILGRILQAVAKNLLSSVGFDGLAKRLGLEAVFEKKSPSEIVGLGLMVLVMLHAGIAAFDRLGLEALSEPISSTIDQFWALMPALAVSAVILAVGVVIGRVARTLVSGLLSGVGLDTWLAKLGLDLKRFGKNEEKTRRVDSPSELVGFIVQFAVVTVALVQVLDNLGLAVWSEMVQTFLSYTFLKVLVALLIVGGGLMLGNYVRDLIAGQSKAASQAWIGGAARIAVLVFTFTMGLQQLEVAPTFVLLTFGLVFGALCLALALAFGLGARGVAADIVRAQYDKAGKKSDEG